jgi:hypothetical protein
VAKDQARACPRLSFSVASDITLGPGRPAAAEHAQMGQQDCPILLTLPQSYLRHKAPERYFFAAMRGRATFLLGRGHALRAP